MCPHRVSSSIRPDQVLGVVTVTLWGVVGVLGVGFFPPVQLPRLDSRPMLLGSHRGCCLFVCSVVLFSGNGSCCALDGDATVYPRFRVC